MKDMVRYEDLTEAGRLWLDAIDELADMDYHTPEHRATRNLMLARLDKLETVFRALQDALKQRGGVY